MLKIQRLSAASHRLTSPKGKIIMIDPWLAGDPLWPTEERDPQKLAEIDAIVVTHAHIDHLPGVGEICKTNKKALVICQFELAMILMQKGVTNVYPLNYGGTAIVGGIKYSMVPAAHSSSLADDATKYVGSPAGFVIELEDGFKVYIAGDTGLIADMKLVVGDYFKPDLAILPVVGTLVMEPEQAVFAANLIGAKYIVPTHDFPEKFSEAADSAGYEKFSKFVPFVLKTKEKTAKFIKLLKEENLDIEIIKLDIGETKEIKY